MLKFSRQLLLCCLFIFINQPLIVLAEQDPLALPDLGDSGLTSLSPGEEVRIGQSVVRNIRSAGGVIDDPLLHEYINNLGYELLSHYGQTSYPFHFFIVNDKDINAFALPGGFIGINYGLFMATEDESELASVVAHEIAHVTQRHHARAYDVGKNSNVTILAALLAALVLGSSDSNVGQAAFASAAAATAQAQINFTRANEQEADRIGINLLAKSGFDATKMATFFDKLGRKLGGIQAPEFLLTHPLPPSRVTDALGRAAALPKPQPRDETSYYIMRNRIIALASRDDQRTQSLYEDKLDKKSVYQRNAKRYGHALSLMKQEKFQAAADEIKQLLAKDPHRIAYLLAYADAQQGMKDYAAAFKSYRHALALYPNNHAIMHDYVALLLQQDDAREAQKTLQTFLKQASDNPVFYKFLARSEAALGNKAKSHQAMAEYYYQIGQIHQAVTQLRIALRQPDLDFYLISQLEARLENIQRDTNPDLLQEPTNKGDSP